MLGKIPLEICQCPLGGELSVPEQVNYFFVRGLFSKFLDVNTAISQNSLLTINESNCALSDNDALETSLDLCSRLPRQALSPPVTIRILLLIKQYQDRANNESLFQTPVGDPVPEIDELPGKTHRIAVLPGDGIGPEVVDATLAVLKAVQRADDVRLEMIKGDAGFYCIEKSGTNLPDKTVEMIKKTDACLKGPMTTPEEPGSPRSVAVTLRSMFDLYANMRPARSLPNVPSLKPNIDMIVVRENTEDLYVGKEFEVAPGVGIAIKINTRHASERIAKFAFDLAKKRRKKLAFVHKANILKITDGIFKPAGGSAPKYTGQNKVNPVAMIEASRMMLDFLGEEGAAQKVEKATMQVLEEGKVLTFDLGGYAKTSEMGEAIAKKILSLGPTFSLQAQSPAS